MVIFFSVLSCNDAVRCASRRRVSPFVANRGNHLGANNTHWCRRGRRSGRPSRKRRNRTAIFRTARSYEIAILQECSRIVEFGTHRCLAFALKNNVLESLGKAIAMFQRSLGRIR